jgi:uncharacterized protein (DUF2235 family)
MRRLIICFDGTWNQKTSTTNIWRIYTLIQDRDEQGVEQKKQYIRGVGTRWYDSFLGGTFGAGVYANVQEAYTWLTEVYRPGDELSLFGFSRGAVTALSLANLIDRCGIIRPDSLTTFEEVYRLYQLPGFIRASPASLRIRARSADYGLSALRFLGLFDTVAGLYGGRIFNESMHILSLPDSVAHVSHALAIDENRRPFRSVIFPSAPLHGKLEERWFTGAHANVGGGYPFDPLATLSLLWMLGSASKNADIAFTPIREFDINEALAVRERDSYREFALGIPALVPVPRRFRRRRVIGRQVTGNAEEWIDSSAVRRYIGYPSYQARSVALMRHMSKKPAIQIIPGDIHVRK